MTSFDVNQTIVCLFSLGDLEEVENLCLAQKSYSIFGAAYLLEPTNGHIRLLEGRICYYWIELIRLVFVYSINLLVSVGSKWP